MPPEPKPKRQFKFMIPKVNLGKHTKTFGYLTPISGCAVGIGMVYDAPLLGLGLKWGVAVALLVFAIFFVGMVWHHIENG